MTNLIYKVLQKVSFLALFLPSLSAAYSVFAAGTPSGSELSELSQVSQDQFRTPDSNGTCPPCFNCMLPIFECKQFSRCNEFNGRCECIEGFGGDDCSQPLCGSLADGNENRPQREDDTRPCECEPGWGGVNCNICQEDSVCDAFMPDTSLKGTCYKNGMIVKRIFEMCNVTNPKILQILNGKIPQVSFYCNRNESICNFQFWIDNIESFYCGLEECSFDYDIAKNNTHYKCEKAQCKCIHGTTLCGAGGSVDIGDFLTQVIKGPGNFICDLHSRRCRFTEPAMNDLIQSIFGDPYIELECESGECLHYSEIPGYRLPSSDNYMSLRGKLILSLTSVALFIFATFAVFYISNSPLFKTGGIRLPDDHRSGDIGSGADESFLKSDFLTTLSFENVSYSVPSLHDPRQSETVLKNVSGLVKPGQILAIMGGSGAGKTTLLDILAMKRKTGKVTGDIRVNGVLLPRKIFTKLVGFVDQDDFLLPTLTVYETVLNSALLRLPRTMPFEAKQARVLQVLEELRIFDIKDRTIGDEFQRGISGGEKRRVSIACELVTSPLILFLDEPTSGLDANNANNIVECLVKLARNYNRTLVMSIHQPRSNIFNLFDKLILLSNGDTIYSGNAIRINEFLINNGFRCPSNYNIADYLIDITFESRRKSRQEDTEPEQVDGRFRDLEVGSLGIPENMQRNIHSPEAVVGNSSSEGSVSSATQREWEHYALHRDEIRTILKDGADNTNTVDVRRNNILVGSDFTDSSYYEELKQEIQEVTNYGNADNSNPRGSLELIESSIPKAQKSATFGQQLSILCSRTFKNIYRNPKLLLANYLMTILLGLFLGTLYYNIANDISGFQNRMGLFFFILTYFGFVTFTGLSSFSVERIIFIKERSNNYYSPLAYYISKIISDVLPLRVVPPVLMMLIIYPLTGLNMSNNGFFKCIGILILFNLSVSLEILTIGIIFKSLNNSIILSVLVLLASILFSGLFINTKELTNVAFKYLKNLSVFYYAYEALLINEVKSLVLRERKFGLNIEVPGATILSTFGFVVQNMVFDMKVLGLFNLIFLLVGYAALHLIVVEQK